MDAWLSDHVTRRTPSIQAHVRSPFRHSLHGWRAGPPHGRMAVKPCHSAHPQQSKRTRGFRSMPLSISLVHFPSGRRTRYTPRIGVDQHPGRRSGRVQRGQSVDISVGVFLQPRHVDLWQGRSISRGGDDHMLEFHVRGSEQGCVISKPLHQRRVGCEHQELRLQKDCAHRRIETRGLGTASPSSLALRTRVGGAVSAGQ